MILRHPITQRRRHQIRLITIHSNEVLRHAGILLTRPDDKPPLYPTATVQSSHDAQPTLPSRGCPSRTRPATPARVEWLARCARVDRLRFGGALAGLPASAFALRGRRASLVSSRASSSDPACLAARSLRPAGRLLCSSDRTIRINGERSHGSGASRDPFPGKRSSQCGRRPAAARDRVRPPASSGADVRCPGDRPEHPASGPPCRWRMRACAQRAEMHTRSGLQVG
jgi:hypothetical protein